MIKISKLLRQLAAAFAVTSAALSANAAVTTQLGFLWDESGSISSSNFNLMKQGYAAALAALPTDGSIEVTIYGFSTGTEVIVAPTVINSVAARTAVVNAINANTQSNGLTNTASGITDITRAMVSSSNYSSGLASIINIATDGEPTTGGNSVDAAIASEKAGIDALTAEGIALGSSGLNFLKSIVFSPLAGPCSGCGTLLPVNSTPPNPMTSNPWVLPVNTFDDFGVAINAKVQAIVNPTPEPGTLALLGIAVAGLAAGKRRAARRQSLA